MCFKNSTVLPIKVDLINAGGTPEEFRAVFASSQLRGGKSKKVSYK